MSEAFSVQIAGGNTLLNKISLVLNRAGDMPQNPILRGLGMAIDIKLSPDVLSFESQIGLSSPPDDSILVFTRVGSSQYRVYGAVGYGSLMLDTDYTEPVRHYISMLLQGASRVRGFERQFWVVEDPLIELGYCAGSATQSAWLARASEAYYASDTSPAYGLTFDPGEPDTVGVGAGESGSPWYVVAGPNRVIEFAVYDVNQQYPLNIPLRLMDNWRDEFNQKHYGGAKYVSVFEYGEAEDHHGSYIVNEYQTAIETLDSIQVQTADTDHEYKIVLRFRSELNDSYYVDKVVRFRVLTADILNRQFVTDLYEDDLPEIVYNQTTQEFFWSGMTAFVASYGITSAYTQYDMSPVMLPTDDATAFPHGWLSIRAVTYGGEIPIRFQRTDGPATIETIKETYTVTRTTPTSPNVTVAKTLFYRYIHSSYADFQPDFQCRLIEPTSPGAVYLEVINNQTRYKQAVAWTNKGSINLPLPLRNGQRHNITTIIDVDGTSGAVQNEVINLFLQTEDTARFIQVAPVPAQALIRARYPLIGAAPTDDVIPTFTPSWPGLEWTFPATSQDGESYSIVGGEAGAGWADAVMFNGRKGMVRNTSSSPGGTVNHPTLLSTCCHSDGAVFWCRYRIKYTSGPDNGTYVDYVIESPTSLGYSGTPPAGTHPGDLQLILYDTIVTLVDKPSDLYLWKITGNLGDETFGPGSMLEDQFYDVAHLVDAHAASIQLDYSTIDYSTTPPTVTWHGPYTVPRFTPISMPTVFAVSMDDTVWSTGRLTNGPWEMPLAKINWIDKTIEFDFEDNYAEWIRWAVVNPHDHTRLVFQEAPLSRTLKDISRCFREDQPYNIQPGQSLVVVFLHSEGPHYVGVYAVTDEWEEPLQLNNLRGDL